MQERQKEYLAQLERRRRAFRAEEKGKWKRALEMSRKWHLTPLAELRLPPNDKEIRFWDYRGILFRWALF